MNEPHQASKKRKIRNRENINQGGESEIEKKSNRKNERDSIWSKYRENLEEWTEWM